LNSFKREATASFVFTIPNLSPATNNNFSLGLLFSGLCRGRLDCWVADVSIAMLLSSSELVNKLLHSLFTSSEEDSSMAIETSATQQSRRPRHNPENNNPIDNGSLFTSSEEDSSMAIETSATQQSRRPRHNPENNNPIDNGSLFTSSEEDSSMAIETSATQQSRRPRHNPENNNPIDNGRENLHSNNFSLS
jgi:hypothetical protein